MTKNHPNLSREVRVGALAALEALKQAEAMAEAYEVGSENETPQESLQADIEHRQHVVAAFLAAAGELPPHAQGFIAALAEYIDFGCQIGEVNLIDWKPDAAMTAREIERSRVEWLADMVAN